MLFSIRFHYYFTSNSRYLLNNVLKNCDVEKLISVNFNNVDINISHSNIAFVQVFQNLLTNSKKFNDKEECEVIISFNEIKDEYQFVYEDNGPGISKKYWDKVFIMFETLDDSSIKNTGIGLATVKSIINRFGGEIHLNKRSNGEEGVCFKFSLPKTNIHDMNN